jgi:hypothetical protein
MYCDIIGCPKSGYKNKNERQCDTKTPKIGFIIQGEKVAPTKYRV